MRKFHDRLTSLSSTKYGTRVVNLRRTGQSGEEVRQLALNMDAISGGLDEVKWKCACFLYDMDEVAQVAPSQILLLAFPGHQLLASKSERSALSKFLKPGTVWTIDIGAYHDSSGE